MKIFSSVRFYGKWLLKGRPCDVAGRAESAFVAREEVQPGEV
jgi:hypothetical protein